jgi:hypothetical protein
MFELILMEPIARNLGTAAPLANRREQRSDPVQFFFQDRTTFLMSRLADQPCDWDSLNGSTANPFRFTANPQQGIDSPETNLALRSLIEVPPLKETIRETWQEFSQVLPEGDEKTVAGASLRFLSPGQAYGRDLHALVRLHAERKQYFGSFFLGNRAELELMQRLADTKVRPRGRF